MVTIYDFKANTLQGQEKDLADYKGKVVLIVNTASKCGLTPQYEGLQALYEKYKEQGLEILGFPCNQFANQEAGDADSIKETCQINYGVSFQMFDKIEVNGEGAHPLYQFLKKEQSGFLGSKIKWNFTKFLVNKEGQPVDRFAPITKPEKMKKTIERLLNN